MLNGGKLFLFHRDSWKISKSGKFFMDQGCTLLKNYGEKNKRERERERDKARSKPRETKNKKKRFRT